MKIKTRIQNMVGVCLLSLAIQSCATLQQAGTSGPTDTDQHVIYVVKQGDSLSDISLKLTGEVSNWQSIAKYNEISDPKKLAAGDSLKIPHDLLAKIYTIGAKSNLHDIQIKDSVAAASAPSRAAAPAIGTTTMAMQRTLDRNFGEVTVHAVSVNRSFDLVPFDQMSVANTKSFSFASRAPSVRVIGTYFPKGVYEEPANYSKLIMRVTPGTLFEFDREVNGWYKVVTDQGVGYLRSADAVLVEEPSF